MTLKLPSSLLSCIDTYQWAGDASISSPIYWSLPGWYHWYHCLSEDDILGDWKLMNEIIGKINEWLELISKSLAKSKNKLFIRMQGISNLSFFSFFLGCIGLHFFHFFHFLLLYASTWITFHLVLCRSRRFSVTLHHLSSHCHTYHPSSLITVTSALILCSVLHPGSILPFLCYEHQSSVLWLDYHSLTSLHSCG